MRHASGRLAWPVAVEPAVARLVMGGYVMVVAAALAVLFATGARSVAIFAGAALLLVVAADGVRAAGVLFLFMPTLSELLPGEFGSVWYVALYPLAWVWLKAVVARPQRIHGRFLLLYGLFVFSMLLSLHFGADWRMYLPESWAPEAKWRILEPVCSSLPALLISGVIATRQDVRRLGWWIVVGGLVHCVLSFTINLPDPNWTDLEGRDEGLFLGSVHVMGLFATFYLVLTVALLLNERGGLRQRLLAGSALVFLAMIIKSGSRTTLVGLVMLSAVTAVAHWPRIRQRLTVVHVYVAAAFSLTLLAMAASVTKITGIWASFAAGRGALIVMALELFAENPITGAGIGLHVPMLSHEPLAFGYGINFIHTYYVTILAEMGLIGFTLYVLIIGLVLRQYRTALRLFRSAGDMEMYQIGFAFYLAFLSALLMLFTQADTADRAFWALAGIALALRHIAARTVTAPNAAPPLPPPAAR